VGRGALQVRALETTDGHDQTEFNRILHGVYVVGQPGRSMPQQTPWPYLPTALDTSRGGQRATDPAHDLDPRRGTVQSTVSKRLLQVWEPITVLARVALWNPSHRSRVKSGHRFNKVLDRGAPTEC